MMETPDLILDKAKLSDWRDMYRNVWSHPESARYMLWSPTTDEADAKPRMERTIAFQKEHDTTYLVYEKATGKAIGFAGVKKVAEGIYEESGICLGPDYVGRGYGRQILRALIQYCKERHGAVEFRYTTRAENVASVALARSFGFALTEEETRIDDRDGQSYQWLKYSLKL